jgi:hypothetical protein
MSWGAAGLAAVKAAAQYDLRTVVPKEAQKILKGGARGAKLSYSLKINKKHKYNKKNLISITR